MMTRARANAAMAADGNPKQEGRKGARGSNKPKVPYSMMTRARANAAMAADGNPTVVASSSTMFSNTILSNMKTTETKSRSDTADGLPSDGSAADSRSRKQHQALSASNNSGIVAGSISMGLNHVQYWESHIASLRVAMNLADGYTTFIQCMERIPYVSVQTTELKRLVAEISNYSNDHRAEIDTVNESLEQLEQLDDEAVIKMMAQNDVAMLKSFDETQRCWYLKKRRETRIERRETLIERREKLIERRAKEMEQIRVKLVKEVSLAMNHVSKVHTTAINLDHAVSVLSALSQTETQSYYEMQSKSTVLVEEKVATARVCDAPVLVVNNLNDNVKPIDRGIFTEDNLLKIREDYLPGDLKMIQDVFNKAVEKCGKLANLANPSSEDKANYDKAIAKMLARFTDVVTAGITNEETWFSDCYSFPGPVCQEVAGVQEVLTATWLAIGANLKISSLEERDSPPKNNITRERYLEDVKDRKQRVVDAVVSVRGANYAKIIRDDAVELLVEMKPGQRSDAGPYQLIRQQRAQMLGHLGKQSGRGLNFGGGIGIPTYVTGLIAGLGHVQILQLHLVDPGTENGCLELRATRLLPLMTKKNFQTWYTSDNHYKKYAKQWRLLEQILYPESHTSNSETSNSETQNEEVRGMDGILLAHSKRRYADDNDVLLGWKVLLSVMTASRREFVGTWGKNMSNENFSNMIGFGSFSMVFKVKNTDSVIKVSACRDHGHISNEIAFLNILSIISEYPNTLTRIQGNFNGSTQQKFSIGGIEIGVPYVELSPCGQSLYYFLLKQKTEDKKQSVICDIGKGIHSALEFIHGHMICHNDVSDKNIVLKDGMPVLIDFGNAATLGDTKTVFLGTTEFAHRSIHGAKWTCKKEYDLASLGFTMATILEGGRVAWKNLSSGPVTGRKSVFDDRLKKARDIILGAGSISADVLACWVKWILHDEIE